MLTFNSTAGGRFCDGVSRRSFLKVGALGMGGLTLPQLLKAEAAAGIRKSHKAIIMIYLPGGPPHQDMYDLKNDAPRRFAGRSARWRRTCRASASANICRASRG